MKSGDLVAISLPFLMAYVLQGLRLAGDRLAGSVLDRIAEGRAQLKGEARLLCVETALVFHRQVSFFGSVLLSTVSALALAVQASEPTVAVLAAFLLLLLLGAWYARWQIFSVPDDLRVPRQKEMNNAVWAATTVLFAATLFGRLFTT